MTVPSADAIEPAPLAFVAELPFVVAALAAEFAAFETAFAVILAALAVLLATLAVVAPLQAEKASAKAPIPRTETFLNSIFSSVLFLFFL
jgi:hypothetical protein